MGNKSEQSRLKAKSINKESSTIKDLRVEVNRVEIPKTGVVIVPDLEPKVGFKTMQKKIFKRKRGSDIRDKKHLTGVTVHRISKIVKKDSSTVPTLLGKDGVEDVEDMKKVNTRMSLKRLNAPDEKEKNISLENAETQSRISHRLKHRKAKHSEEEDDKIEESSTEKTDSAHKDESGVAESNRLDVAKTVGGENFEKINGIGIQLKEVEKKQVVNISVPPLNGSTWKLSMDVLHKGFSKDILIERVKKPNTAEEEMKSDSICKPKEERQHSPASVTKSAADENERKSKLQKLIGKNNAEQDSEVVVIFKKTDKIYGEKISEAKRRRQRKILFSKKEGSLDKNFYREDEDSDEKYESSLKDRKIKVPVRHINTRKTAQAFEMAEEANDVYNCENSFDRFFTTEDKICDHNDSLDSDSGDDVKLLSHFIDLKQENNQSKSNDKTPPANIHDLMREVTWELPAWNIHALGGNSFCLAKIETGGDGLPIVNKCISIDEHYNVTVQINRTVRTEFNGEYSSYDSLKKLISTIDSS